VRPRPESEAAPGRLPTEVGSPLGDQGSTLRVQVITDSTAAIPADLRAAHHIVSVPLNVVMGHQSISEDNLDEVDFYEHLAHGDPPATTTQPPLDRMRAALAAPAARGQDTVGVFISADLSGTFSAATLAREMVLAEHPQATIELIDSRTAAMHLGLGVLAAAKASQAGACVADVVATATAHWRAHASSSSPLRWSTCAAAVASAAPRPSWALSCVSRQSSRRPTVWPPSTKGAHARTRRERDAGRFLSRYREPPAWRKWSSSTRARRQRRATSPGSLTSVAAACRASCPYLP